MFQKKKAWEPRFIDRTKAKYLDDTHDIYRASQDVQKSSLWYCHLLNLKQHKNRYSTHVWCHHRGLCLCVLYKKKKNSFTLFSWRVNRILSNKFMRILFSRSKQNIYEMTQFYEWYNCRQSLVLCSTHASRFDYIDTHKLIAIKIF